LPCVSVQGQALACCCAGGKASWRLHRWFR